MHAGGQSSIENKNLNPVDTVLENSEQPGEIDRIINNDGDLPNNNVDLPVCSPLEKKDNSLKQATCLVGATGNCSIKLTLHPEEPNAASGLENNDENTVNLSKPVHSLTSTKDPPVIKGTTCNNIITKESAISTIIENPVILSKDTPLFPDQKKISVIELELQACIQRLRVLFSNGREFVLEIIIFRDIAKVRDI